jgi:hypothetical protein
LRNPISAFYPLENDIYFGHFSKKWGYPPKVPKTRKKDPPVKGNSPWPPFFGLFWGLESASFVVKWPKETVFSREQKSP